MDYIEIAIRTTDLSDINRELLTYWLEELGFEGFQEDETELIAYIPVNLYDRNAFINMLSDKKIQAENFKEVMVPEKNWNEFWEKNFEPVLIDNRCLIRAPFHKPDNTYPLEIIIEPKMSFGTGHHETTSLMVSALLTLDIINKSVLDAGCGTGILAILAEKLGAADILAVDVDEWSYRNAIENAGANNCTHITLVLDDAAAVTGKEFDLILANINLNILKSGLKNYAALLKPKGILLMSGILISDIESLKYESEKHNLVFECSNTLHNWAVIMFKKK